MDGGHTLEPVLPGDGVASCERFSTSLHTRGVMLEGMILKPNMALPGSTCPRQESVAEVADATMRVGCCYERSRRAVPGLRSCRAANPAELASPA